MADKSGTPLNEIQVKALSEYYEAIDDALFDGAPTLEQVNENKHGDTLLTFIINEVGDAADADEAKEMLVRAAHQLLHVARYIG